MPAPDRTAALDYATTGSHRVAGWLGEGAASATLLLARAQDRAGITGDVGEIGIHHGRYFILLALLLNPGEAALAIDLFGEQQANLDRSGRGDRAIFEANLAQHLGPAAPVVIRQGDTLRLGPAAILCEGRRSFRLFSIDGGHTTAHVGNDLDLVEPALHPQGVVAIDDFYNPAWPGVNEGVHRYWFSGGRLRPFAYGAGKLFVCPPAAWEFYYATMAETIPLALQHKRVTLANTPCLQLELPLPATVFPAGWG